MLRHVSKLKYLLGLAIIIGTLGLGPDPVSAQQGDETPTIQDLIVNGGFEGGFQEEFGIGYGWGGFSNGNAVVGWNFDDWQAVIPEGQYAQRIEIRNASEIDRYAGIFQTVSVVPGQQYKLTIRGLVRSTEGDIDTSDYGYRVQYAVDPGGGTAWELVNGSAWQELPWDEQPMTETDSGAFRHETYETTVTATGDRLTLFIRGWKKWINNGSGVYDIDSVSLIGPAPTGFQAPVAQVAAVDNPDEQVAGDFPADSSETISEQSGDVAGTEPQMQAQTTAEQAQTPVQQEAPAETNVLTELKAQAETETSAQARSSSRIVSSVQPLAAPGSETAPLPVSGQGSDDSINFVVIIGAVLLLVLLTGAVTATIRRRLA